LIQWADAAGGGGGSIAANLEGDADPTDVRSGNGRGVFVRAVFGTQGGELGDSSRGARDGDKDAFEAGVGGGGIGGIVGVGPRDGDGAFPSGVAGDGGAVFEGGRGFQVAVVVVDVVVVRAGFAGLRAKTGAGGIDVAQLHDFIHELLGQCLSLELLFLNQSQARGNAQSLDCGAEHDSNNDDRDAGFDEREAGQWSAEIVALNGCHGPGVVMVP